MFIIFRGMIKSWSTFITLCYSPFLWKFIELKIFHLVSIFNGFIHWWASMLLHTFDNLYVCWTFNLYLVSNLLDVRPTNVILVNILAITRVSYLQVYFYLIHVWCVTVWMLSTNILHTSICCMYLFGPKLVPAASVHSQ